MGGGKVVLEDLRIRRVDRTSTGSGTEPGSVVSTESAVYIQYITYFAPGPYRTNSV